MMQHTILVPVSTAPASIDAVRTACALGRVKKSKVIAVHVIEVVRSLPLNAGMDAEARRGEQVLRRAEEAAEAAGYPIEAELLQARDAGQAIVDEARDREVEIVLMGVQGAHEVGGEPLSRTAAFVLKHVPCELWLVRQPIESAVPAGRRGDD